MSMPLTLNPVDAFTSVTDQVPASTQYPVTLNSLTDTVLPVCQERSRGESPWPGVARLRGIDGRARASRGSAGISIRAPGSESGECGLPMPPELLPR